MRWEDEYEKNIMETLKTGNNICHCPMVKYFKMLWLLLSHDNIFQNAVRSIGIKIDQSLHTACVVLSQICWYKKGYRMEVPLHCVFCIRDSK